MRIRRFFLYRFLSAVLILALSLESGPALAFRGQEPSETDVSAGLEEALTPVRPEQTVHPSTLQLGSGQAQAQDERRVEGHKRSMEEKLPQMAKPAGLEEGGEASAPKVPARLVRYFGQHQAAIIYDEVRKTVTRLMPEAAPAERERGIKEISLGIRPLTFPQLLLHDHFVRFIYLGFYSVLLLPFAGLRSIGENADLPFLSRLSSAFFLLGPLLFFVVGPIVNTIYVVATNNLGLYDPVSGSVFVEKNGSGFLTREAVSHELAHHFFRRSTYVQNAVSQLRSLEEGSSRPDPAIVSLVKRTPIDVLEATLRDRAKQEVRQESPRWIGWFKTREWRWVESSWTYEYGDTLGQAIYILVEGNYPKAYRIVTLMGKGDSLVEALRKVSEQEAGQTKPSDGESSTAGLEEGGLLRPPEQIVRASTSSARTVDRLEAEIRVRRALERIAPYLSDTLVVGIGPSQAKLHADLFETIGEVLSDSDPEVRQKFLDRIFVVTNDANQAVRLQGQGWLASNYPDYVALKLIDRFSGEAEAMVIDYYATEEESGVLRGRISDLWPELKDWLRIERQETESDPDAFLHQLLDNLVSVPLDFIPALGRLLRNFSLLIEA